MTEEFLLENFRNYPVPYRLKDIVYVAANPFVSLLLSNKFHQIYPVWEYGWDENLGTVPPVNVVKDSLKASKKHPDKRLIIHFMQPHAPFLGSTFSGVTGFSMLRNAVLKDGNRARDTQWGELVKNGVLNLEKVLLAYEKNLKIVLLYVEELVKRLPGITVITSDHGNLFGERPHLLYPFKEYGHHAGLNVKELVLVPWLVRGRERKKINVEKNRINTKLEKLRKTGAV